MNKSGPILIIEDDPDDRFLLGRVFSELNYLNEIIFLDDSVKALEYLTNGDVDPFLVLSDINMPVMNGIELRHSIHINDTLRLKYIPYIILTTSDDHRHVHNAYLMAVHGYFIKPAAYDQLKNTISLIVQYWQACELPIPGGVTTA